MTATGSDQNDMNAAFATVVWEITHQDSDGTTAAEILADLDISTGNARFSSGSAVTGLAIDWLNSLGGGTDDFLWFNGLVGLSDPTTQDFHHRSWPAGPRRRLRRTRALRHPDAVAAEPKLPGTSRNDRCDSIAPVVSHLECLTVVRRPPSSR